MLLIGQVFNVIFLEIFPPLRFYHTSINALMLLYSYILSISDDSPKRTQNLGVNYQKSFETRKTKRDG